MHLFERVLHKKSNHAVTNSAHNNSRISQTVGVVEGHNRRYPMMLGLLEPNLVIESGTRILDSTGYHKTISCYCRLLTQWIVW